MKFIFGILAVLIMLLIEAWRINRRKGEVENINKVITYTIGAFLYGISLALIYNYYDNPSPLDILLYTLYLLGVRGVVYDPLLNVLTHKKIDLESKTTNSILDWIEINIIKIPFWWQRLIYLVLTVIFGLLWAHTM